MYRVGQGQHVNFVIIDSLPPKAHLWVSRDQLSSAIGSTWNGTASLKLSSSPADLRLLNLNLVGNQTFFNFSCFEFGTSAKNFAPKITNRSREFFLVEGDPFSLFATASDANNDPVTFSLDGELIADAATVMISGGNEVKFPDASFELEILEGKVKGGLPRFEVSKGDVVEINPVGEKLDPNFHQAMSLIDSDLELNTIVNVIQKGYKIGDRLVRPALVTVSNGKKTSIKED